jgi:hypothetical protein
MEERFKNCDIIIKLIVLFVLIYLVVVPNKNYAPQPINTPFYVCKEDSLQEVIKRMEIDKETQEDGWDNKERRYESILFEYQYGLDHLKNNQPEAYREFHRILAHKEYYSHEDERENTKRLKNVDTMDLWR